MIKNFGQTLKVFSLVSLFVFASVASAATYEGETVSKVVNRSGKNLNGSTVQSLSITSDIYRVSLEWRWVDEVVFDCEDDLLSDGTSGDWKGFFNAPKEDKAARLAAAIKGVGISTAERLLEDGVFSNKPRSWRQFADRIERASEDYGTGFGYQVLVEFKKENMINLGYLVEGQCGTKVVSVRKLVPVKNYYRTESKDFEIRIKNAPLLRGEQERITISFDGFDDKIYVSSDYNSYVFDRWENNNKVVYELDGTRLQVRPANSLEVTRDSITGTLKLKVVDSAFDSDLGHRRVIVGKVELDKSGWKKNVLLGSIAPTVLDTDDAVSVIDTGVVVEAGSSIIVRYSIRYEDSQYYNSDESSSKKLKLKL